MPGRVIHAVLPICFANTNACYTAKQVGPLVCISLSLWEAHYSGKSCSSDHSYPELVSFWEC